MVSGLALFTWAEHDVKRNAAKKKLAVEDFNIRVGFKRFELRLPGFLFPLNVSGSPQVKIHEAGKGGRILPQGIIILQ